MKTTLTNRKPYVAPAEAWWRLRIECFCGSGNLPSTLGDGEDPIFDEDFN